jgi:hypothetical protein
LCAAEQRQLSRVGPVSLAATSEPKLPLHDQGRTAAISLRVPESGRTAAGPKLAGGFNLANCTPDPVATSSANLKLKAVNFRFHAHILRGIFEYALIDS